MKITEIKKDIRRKLKSSIDEITERAEDIMNEELEGLTRKHLSQVKRMGQKHITSI
ncbi:hypothetical protein [Frisingicoccus sp.]|uniref:hypothetical protein n=1 Tax=Frisingicoccus sp. TaxID=1918627 RepID=UPI00399AF60E